MQILITKNMLNVIAIASVLIKKEAAVCHAASLRGMCVKSFTQHPFNKVGV